MIKEYRNIIIMAITLLILIIGVVLVLTTDIDLGIFENLAIANISEKKVTVDTLMLKETQEKIKHEQSIDKLEQSKNDYEEAKQKFDNIDQATIDLVQEATKDEQYFIEYLWIVLGNYAKDNDLLINIITPGSTSGSTSSTDENTPALDTSVANGAVKMVVRGRYANVADFVYEVENDKELKFRLDNIKMTYVSNNTIEATFNVLSLKVKK